MKSFFEMKSSKELDLINCLNKHFLYLVDDFAFLIIINL